MDQALENLKKVSGLEVDIRIEAAEEESVVGQSKLLITTLPYKKVNVSLSVDDSNVCTISPKSFIFSVNAEPADSSIDFFLGLNVHPRKEYYYSLYWYFNMMKERIPNNFLKIASDPFGNAILIDLDRGSIWFWDHELEADIEGGEDFSQENIFFISENLNSFLKSLQEMGIENI